jgi:PAS domain S-box-containing protein
MAGTDGLCNFFNQVWLDFTGRPMDREVGHGWAEGVHPEDFQACMDTFLTAFVERRPFRMEYRLRRADGAYRWLLDTGVPRMTPSGTFAGYIGSCVDVTEFKEARELLETHVRERTAKLHAANRELEAFTYAVAHDLRAPLRGVGGFAELLLSEHYDKLDEDGRECLSEILQGAKRMADLIDALLSLSRLQRSEMYTAEVDLSALVRSIVAELARTDPRANYELVVAEGVTARMDPQLARAAFVNLLGNAWKFTGKVAVPRIEFGFVEVAGTNAFFVRDNGAGFDASHAKRMFAPFQRLHAATEFAGTGIGLATVQRIVNRHGGRVWADGKVGHGATFYFTLGEPGGVAG